MAGAAKVAAMAPDQDGSGSVAGCRPRSFRGVGAGFKPVRRPFAASAATINGVDYGPARLVRPAGAGARVEAPDGGDPGRDQQIGAPVIGHGMKFVLRGDDGGKAVGAGQGQGLEVGVPVAFAQAHGRRGPVVARLNTGIRRAAGRKSSR